MSIKSFIRSNRSTIFVIAGAVAVFVLVILFGQMNRDSETMSGGMDARRVVIIDAGHGGMDGGAISISGEHEADINLSIALKLEAIMGLFGVDTVMVRTTDTDLSGGSGGTVRERKFADIRARVEFVNSYVEPVYIAIHQNTFTESKYSGAQVFYGKNELGKVMAEMLQENLRLNLNPANMRKIKQSPSSVYIMEHIDCTAVLVECGFISNYTEEQLLLTPQYQTKIAMSITQAYLHYEREPQELT